MSSWQCVIKGEGIPNRELGMDIETSTFQHIISEVAKELSKLLAN